MSHQAHAAIVKRDWAALQPLLHPYVHWACTFPELP
jgi:hypothetical protein